MKLQIFGKTALALIIFLLLTTLQVIGQPVMKIKHSCNFDGEETASEHYIFEASSEADKIISTLLQGIGLAENGFILKEANCKNALATSDGRHRYILYNPIFLQKFKMDVKSKWVGYCVLAHEIAHHLNNHDLETEVDTARKRQELEADKFAGYWLAKMGATLEEAQAGINSLPLENETKTHPPKTARLVAVTNGWTKAKESGVPPQPNDSQLDMIYRLNQVDNEPKFGGIFSKSVKSWIEENIRYNGLESETGGIIDVSFIINKDGSITDAKIIKGISTVSDSEAIRLVRNMPKWEKPGSINKKPVKVFYEMGIEFIDINKTYRLDEIDKKPSGNEGWIANNLKYPLSAQQNRIQGTVLLDFLVDKDGSISDIKIRQALGNGCSEEATRLLQNMPRWNSGRKKGQKVKVLYTSYPINFNLTTQPPPEPTNNKFVIKPIAIKPIAMDDGICCRSITNPRGKVDQKGHIYGQVSMRIAGASNASTFTFWNIPRGQQQLMRQGITYPLSQSLNKIITILSSDLNTAQFILMASGTNNGVQNGIFEFDSDDAHEVLSGIPATTSINLSEVKRLGSVTKTHTFTTGTGKNVIQFIYQIDYQK